MPRRSDLTIYRSINALAETVNGLYKTELIHRRGPWRDLDGVELGTLGWVHWFNTERLHGALGDVPPAEFEAAWAEGLLNEEAAGVLARTAL
jgi:putative transposase